MPLIKCENLTLSYENHIVLEDLSFELNEGDYLCIVGENGSGKSTLVKTLLSLRRPAGGKIVFGDGLLPSEIGYLQQQSGIQKDFPAKVNEIVISGCLNRRGLRPFYSGSEKAAAAENMKRLGIEGLAKKSFSELSGGQQQRVLLARALMAAKKLIMLDEPAAGLDPLVTAELYRLTKELNEGGIAVIMVTHDIEAALTYSNRVLHLQSKPLFYGRTEDYANTELAKRFLGVDHYD